MNMFIRQMAEGQTEQTIYTEINAGTSDLAASTDNDRAIGGS